MFLFIIIFSFVFLSIVVIAAVSPFLQHLPFELPRGQPSLTVFSFENGSHFCGSFCMKRFCIIAYCKSDIVETLDGYDHLKHFPFLKFRPVYLKSQFSPSLDLPQPDRPLYSRRVSDSTQNVGVLASGPALLGFSLHFHQLWRPQMLPPVSADQLRRFFRVCTTPCDNIVGID